MKRNSIIISVISVFAIAILFGYYFLIPSDKEILLQAEDGFDLEDTEMLVGWADNVFVGEIVKVIDTKSDDVSPVTTYEVKIIENLKGNLLNTVKVSHRIGYSKAQRATIKFPGDSIMNVGDKYLIISRYNNETKSYWLVPVYGDIEIEEGTEEQLLNMYKEKIKNQKQVGF